MSEIEKDFSLLGATAVEDLLHEHAKETVKAVREEGLKFWMLTGDSPDIAMNIGYACELLNDSTKILLIE